MRFKSVTPWVARSTCGNYTIVANADDLYTPWCKTSGRWIHIDGRGCDTAREAAEVCVRHSEGSRREDAA